MDDIDDIVLRHQVLLERLKTSQSVTYGKMLDAIEDLIVRSMAKLEYGKLNEMKSRELQNLLATITAQQQKIIRKQEQQFLLDMEELSAEELKFETDMFQRAIKGVTGFSVVAAKAEAAYQAALLTPLQATGELLKPFIRSYETAQIAAVNNVIRQSRVQGNTVQQAVQAIRGTRNRSGILQASRRKAEAMVRTSIQHVSSTSRDTLWKSNQKSGLVRGYRFVATLDSRTSQVCRSLDSRIFPVGEGPMPPVHVNCRSTTVPEFDKELQRLFDEDATRSSLNGTVKDESYYSWLKRQPAAFQATAIGKTRATLLRKGGLSADKFAKLNLSKSFQPLTLEEMKKLNPAAFDKAGL